MICALTFVANSCSAGEVYTAAPNPPCEEQTAEVCAEESAVCAAEKEPERQMWDYLMLQYENQYAAAAILGNADYESDMCSYRTESDKTLNPETGEYEFSRDYTAKVDSGEIGREEFSCCGPGGGAYGLFAWTGAGRKEGLYDLAQERKASVSDWKLQLDYAYNEINERYLVLYYELVTADSVESATEAFCETFERPKNMFNSMIKRSELALSYYERFADPDFESPYSAGDLVPINGSTDYIYSEIEQDFENINVYTYIAQDALLKLGYMDIEPSGYFGWETYDAISQLKEDNGFEPDGALDNITWKLLSK